MIKYVIKQKLSCIKPVFLLTNLLAWHGLKVKLKNWRNDVWHFQKNLYNKSRLLNWIYFPSSVPDPKAWKKERKKERKKDSNFSIWVIVYIVMIAYMSQKRVLRLLPLSYLEKYHIAVNLKIDFDFTVCATFNPIILCVYYFYTLIQFNHKRRIFTKERHLRRIKVEVIITVHISGEKNQKMLF